MARSTRTAADKPTVESVFAKLKALPEPSQQAVHVAMCLFDGTNFSDAVTDPEIIARGRALYEQQRRQEG